MLFDIFHILSYNLTYVYGVKYLKDVIIDTLIDGIKLIPFLFVAFLIIELLEHKLNTKTKSAITKSGKFGPIIGSLLGIIPQCGFSVVATNLYITRVISLGTLFSIYLSTSDEMLPIMISHNVDFKIVFGILLIKFICGLIFGFIFDSFLHIKDISKNYDYNMCDSEHCDCEHGIFKSSIKHTFKTLFFIIVVSFILNVIIDTFGLKIIGRIFMKDNLFGPFLGSLIGLIPNCGASVALTELYIQNAINFGTCIAGLLTGSGVAIMLLFKSNKNFKENMFILISLYLIGVFVGIIIEILAMLI